MFSAAGTDRFRLGRGPLVPGGSQLDRAGSFAFLAPMPLRAIEALPHPAIVANENFFSHANLVSTALLGLCQALFSGHHHPSSGGATRSDAPGGRKKELFPAKKSLSRGSLFLQCASTRHSFGAFIMNLMIVKRVVSVLFIVAGLAICAVGASKKPCPLPASSDSSMSANAQSPEQPQCKRRVMHNGMVICLPCPAADAHVRVHGDEDLGPCDKPGNETPPGQS
jgi:hypothetical protein